MENYRTPAIVNERNRVRFLHGSKRIEMIGYLTGIEWPEHGLVEVYSFTQDRPICVHRSNIIPSLPLMGSGVGT